MAIPYIISTWQKEPKETKETFTMAQLIFNELDSFHVITSGEATAGAAFMRIDFGGRKKIIIETMNIYNDDLQYNPLALGFRVGNKDITLANGTSQPFEGLQYNGRKEIECSGLWFLVNNPDNTDVINFDATWWSEN